MRPRHATVFTHPQLADDTLDETTVLEEELVTMTGAALPADYLEERRVLLEQRDADLREANGNPEVIRRVEGQHRQLRRYRFAGLLKRGDVSRTALCLSGGGIRSATFSLGVIQWLGQHGLLKQFDFLSTVSGGGYIGSWLSAWIHRHPRGIVGVEDDLAGHDPATVVRLREYSNYLAPKFGFLTADTWTLAVTYLRNLLVNWLLFLPFLVAIISLPHVAVALAAIPPGSDGARLAAHLSLFAGALLLGMFTAIGALSLPTLIPGQPSPTGIAKLFDATHERAFLWKCLLPFVLAGILLPIGWLLAQPDMVIRWPFLPFWREWHFTTVPWHWALGGAVFHLVAMTPMIGKALSGGAFRGAWRVIVDPRRAQGFVMFVARAGGAIIACGLVGGLAIYAAVSQYGTIKALLPVELLPEGAVVIYVLVAPVLFWSSILLSGALFVGLTSHFSTDFQREWYARAGAWMFIAIVVWLALVGISVLGPAALVYLWNKQYRVSLSFSAISAGLIAVLGGRQAGAIVETTGAKYISAAKAMFARLPSLAAPVFLAVLLSVLALLATLLVGQAADLHHTRHEFHTFHVLTSAGWKAMATPAVAIVIALFFDLVTDMNVFSLHGMYRDRLVRAYLAASRYVRLPNPFTGIDANDNLPLAQLRPGAFNQCDINHLAKVLRTQLDDPFWNAWPAEPPAGKDCKGARARVRYLLAEVSPVLIWRISKTPPDTQLMPADEQLLLQRWNAVLADAQLYACFNDAAHQAGSAMTDLVRSNRASLEQCDWFSRLAANPSDPAATRGGSTHSVEQVRLFPVINTALNLVGGNDLAWQQRKAEAFALTPLHAGAVSVGYRRSIWQLPNGELKYFAGDTGISIGTAMTISGAAANPSMGYHSSPAVTFLLTMFNARLGTWLGNPARDQASRRGPRWMLPRIVAEAFGRTNRTSPYVNLSDGGHFENLGVYEMIRRRCQFILSIDAGQDGDYAFEDLANAINKARVDFGVSIEFAGKPAMHARKDGPSARTALATIRYGADEQGYLLYVKPAISTKEPVDVTTYAEKAVKFPHEPTSNQFFTERQFESYRMLGWDALDEVATNATSLDELLERFAAADEPYSAVLPAHAGSAGGPPPATPPAATVSEPPRTAGVPAP